MQERDKEGHYLLVHDNNSFRSLWINPSIGKLMFTNNINHMITVDACHTCYNHLLILVAVMQDGNGKLQFIAAGLGFGETKPNYITFLQRLKDYVVGNNFVTIMSDRNKSIKSAVPYVFGKQAQHVCCWKHVERNVYSWTLNMDQKDRDTIHNYILKMASTTKQDTFLFYQKKLKEEYNTIFQKVNGIKHIWARTQLLQNIFGVMTSNAAEIVNGLLKRPMNFEQCIRDSHIVYMTVGIYGLMYSQLEKRREAVDEFVKKNGDLKRVSDFVVKKINAHQKSISFNEWRKGTGCVIRQTKFGHQKFMVDLGNKRCTCQMYQEYGYPCIHAYYYLRKDKLFDNTMTRYVDEYYWMSNVVQTCNTSLPNHPDISLEDMGQFCMDFDEEKCECIKNIGTPYTHDASDAPMIQQRVNPLYFKTISTQLEKRKPIQIIVRKVRKARKPQKKSKDPAFSPGRKKPQSKPSMTIQTRSQKRVKEESDTLTQNPEGENVSCEGEYDLKRGKLSRRRRSNYERGRNADNLSQYSKKRREDSLTS